MALYLPLHIIIKSIIPAAHYTSWEVIILTKRNIFVTQIMTNAANINYYYFFVA